MRQSFLLGREILLRKEEPCFSCMAVAAFTEHGERLSHLQSMKEQAAIDQMKEVMRYDDEIITLRTSIRQRTEAQVQNGEASVNDLLRDMNAEDRARQNKTAHEVEWLKNIYDLKYTVNE